MKSLSFIGKTLLSLHGDGHSCLLGLQLSSQLLCSSAHVMVLTQGTRQLSALSSCSYGLFSFLMKDLQATNSISEASLTLVFGGEGLSKYSAHMFAAYWNFGPGSALVITMFITVECGTLLYALMASFLYRAYCLGTPEQKVPLFHFDIKIVQILLRRGFWACSKP